MSEREAEIFGPGALAAVDAPAQPALIADLPAAGVRRGPGRPVGARSRNGAPDIVARIAELEARHGVTLEELAFDAARGARPGANARVLLALIDRKFGRQAQTVDVRKVGLTMVVSDAQAVDNIEFSKSAAGGLGSDDLEAVLQVIDCAGE